MKNDMIYKLQQIDIVFLIQLTLQLKYDMHGSP